MVGLRFSKYHGAKNDFVLVQDLDGALDLSPELIAAICDRHAGVGADGLIRILRGDGGSLGGAAAAENAGADFFMDYANADGMPAEMCGNGIRCLGKFVADRGLTDRTELAIGTRAGRKGLRLHAEGGSVVSVTVDMGIPSLLRGTLPMTGPADQTFVGQPFELDGRTLVATAISTGNPHLVLFLDPGDDLAALDVPRLGSIVERSDLFPGGTNVEFVQVEGGVVRARVWERGSGLTMACGTGACASLVACALAGRTGREADVSLPGGTLHVVWQPDDRMMMTGPAEWVFDGELSEEMVEAAAAGRGIRAASAATGVR